MPTSVLTLRELELRDEAVFVAAQQAMAAEGFEFGFCYQPGMPWAAYVEQVREGAQRPVGDRVRDSWLLAEVAGQVVGRTSVRHALNDWLAEVGGHIGYCVLPDHRRRGHATEILRQSLVLAAAIGIESALLTCDEHNTGSRTVIERCGGVFERHARTDDGTVKRRYWVPTG